MEPLQIIRAWTAASTSSAWPSTLTLRQILQDPAIGADQNRGANNAQEGPAIHRFFAPGPVGLQHLDVVHPKSEEWKARACPERLPAPLAGRPKRRGRRFRSAAKRARQPREVDGLPGAARGVRARIEKQHEFLAGIVGQRDGAAAIAWQVEGGRLGALGQTGFAGGRRALAWAVCSRPDWRPLCSAVLDRAGAFGLWILTVLMGPSAMLCRSGGFLWCSWSRSWPTSLAFAGRVLAAVAFSPISTGCVRAGLRARPALGALGGFLARFLGHTPSFRRFRRINHGSIAGLVLEGRNRAGCWASLMASEYGYKEFDAPPVRSLTALAWAG